MDERESDDAGMALALSWLREPEFWDRFAALVLGYSTLRPLVPDLRPTLPVAEIMRRMALLRG